MNNKKLRLALAALMGALALALASMAVAETHALLVGVSGYPSLPELRRLRGPASDVLIMSEALRQSGVRGEFISVLADSVPDSKALPTRANILEALAALARGAKPNDWVVVYLSGHGSQQPQYYAGKGYKEPDGLDEIFLPYDVAAWDGKVGKVTGALADDDIGLAFAAITRRGIHLWAIFDTCHAGDMSKGARLVVDSIEEAPTRRYVAPSELGIPSDLMSRARQASAKRPLQVLSGANPAHAKGTAKAEPKATDGQFVAFYSSQSNEPSAEESLPDLLTEQLNKPEKKRRFGAFTWHLAQAIPQWQGSYQSLAAMIEQNYRNVRPFPTPVFEGALQTTPQFGPSGKRKPATP